MQGFTSQFRFAVVFLAVALIGPTPSTAQTAEQRQVTETLSNWGLIGDWSLDCSQPPSRNNGYLNYVVQGGVAMHVRYFGDSSDSHEVLGGRLVENGGLELTVRFRFRDGEQTRRYVVIKQGRQQIRAISNINVATGDASIRNGRFVHNNAETPWQKRCSGSQPPAAGGSAPR